MAKNLVIVTVLGMLWEFWWMYPLSYNRSPIIHLEYKALIGIRVLIAADFPQSTSRLRMRWRVKKNSHRMLRPRGPDAGSV